ncbi:MAG: hypothetical protein L6408_00255, partial [Nanoarchaeota archaeon]|nr:hypothetical protein [Nanoarchaeota archaeon]
KDYHEVLEDMDQELEKIEGRILKTESEKIPYTILDLKKTLLYIRRALVGNRDTINSLKESTLIKKRDLLYDLYIEFVQQVDMVELSRERMTAMLEIYFSLASNKLNVIMKYFAVIAALILLPTLISGIYGMNFISLPLKEHPNGFWMILSIMVLIMGIMFLYFRRKKWI